MRETNESGLWTTGKMDRKHASSWRRRSRQHDDNSCGQNLSLELGTKKFDPLQESAEVLERLQSCFDDRVTSTEESANVGLAISLCCMLKKTSMAFFDSWMLRKANSKECAKKISLRMVTLLVLCLWMTLMPHGAEGSPRSMSETLQRAFANSRGPSPGAKKLLNIPEDGGT